MVVADDATTSFANLICSICYEDLKPVDEDLQAIGICGHVFHELCLQQWFEYCTSGKKRTCPVCKQGCSGSDVCRLYFQSVGGQNETCAAKKAIGFEEDPGFLRGEVRRLEAKVSGFNSIFERQGKEIKQLNEELCLCKEQLKKEVQSRNDTAQQKASMQQLLHSKSQEIDTLKLEQMKLQDRNMALAKELAALKLASDLNLDEDEVLKFASFGNEGSYKDTIDVLRRSLVAGNSRYKELMAKCNQLGRGEARSSKKLEKAKEKINKLKIRVQELGMVVEAQENKALRALKASKIDGRVILNSINDDSKASQKEHHSRSMNKLNPTGTLVGDEKNSDLITDMGADFSKEHSPTITLKADRNCVSATDAATSKPSPDVFILCDSDPDSKHPSREDRKLVKSEAVCDIDRKKSLLESRNAGVVSGSASINNENSTALATTADEEVNMLPDVIKQIQPTLNIKKKFPLHVPLSKPGEVCFSGGLLGPDGTNRYLGKWCKRGPSKGSAPGTSESRGDIIAVGSDGRGGRIKVIRSLNESLLDKENLVPMKKFKYGAQASSLQSKGCLRIEHFFGRASQ